MGLEQNLNHILNSSPRLKKMIKRVYQCSMYALLPKIISEGDIVRVSPNDNEHEYFFGYYDKSPWDYSDRYMLCMRAENTWTDVSPREPADILLIDTAEKEGTPERIRKIATTNTWNIQQGCMLQWLGPRYDTKIIYNDFRYGSYVSIILDVFKGIEKILPLPVYTVSDDGRTALSLDFSRLYNLRPGYGYYNVPEKTYGVALPDETAIWKMDIATGSITELLKYTDFSSFMPRPEMQLPNAIHKVNHIMLRPDGKRFMVIYRWFNGHRKYSRLITCNTDGTDMYLLSDDDMVSHCTWKDNDQILAFENKQCEGVGYYLMHDKTDSYVRCWSKLSNDGHPSYSPDGTLVVTDSYPNRKRIASIKLLNGKNEEDENSNVVAKVFAPFKYDNDVRCDLHPRWNRQGNKICFDGAFEGHRRLYVLNVAGKPVNAEIDNVSSFDMNQVRFIMPLHGFYNTLIQKSGYDIRNPYTGNSLFPRLCREIHFRLHLPFPSIWYNRKNITQKRCIMVYEPLITKQYMEWLHRKNPQSSISMIYINKVTKSNCPDKFRFDWCKLWTSDPVDAAEYKINLFEGLAMFRKFSVSKQKPIYDVFYVGKDKGRWKLLANLEVSFRKLGLRTYFHIVPERRYLLSSLFPRNRRVYKKKMPYEEVLDNVGKTRAILHLLSGSQRGITLRIIESLVYEVKLITDYVDIRTYDFYNPSNIFILGIDSIDTLPDFLQRPYIKVRSKFFEHMYFEDVIKFIATRE